jgi:hypothetical protein
MYHGIEVVDINGNQLDYMFIQPEAEFIDLLQRMLNNNGYSGLVVTVYPDSMLGFSINEAGMIGRIIMRGKNQIEILRPNPNAIEPFTAWHPLAKPEDAGRWLSFWMDYANKITSNVGSYRSSPVFVLPPNPVVKNTNGSALVIIVGILLIVSALGVFFSKLAAIVPGIQVDTPPTQTNEAFDPVQPQETSAQTHQGSKDVLYETSVYYTEEINILGAYEMHVFLTVKNTSAIYLHLESADIVIRNLDGTIVDVAKYLDAYPTIIAPGGSGVFHTDIIIDGGQLNQNYQIQADFSIDESTYKPLYLDISNVSASERTYGGVIFRGEATNSTKDAILRGDVVVYIKDRNGIIIDIQHDAFTTLISGETYIFEIVTSDIKYTDMETYEIFAYQNELQF